MFRAFFLEGVMAAKGITRVMRAARFRLEIALFALAAALIPRLPRGGIVGLAKGAGWLAWWFARRDRRIALANLDLAFGAALTPEEKNAIVRQVFTTFVMTGLDFLWFSRDTRARLERWVILEDSILPLLARGPRIAITAHFGNWEVLGLAAALRGAPLTSVAKPIKNPGIEARIRPLRELSGQAILPREGALKGLVKVLRGEGTVALLLDQDTKVSEGGVFVPFFGVPVPISSAAAGLAARLKVPIATGFSRNEGDGHYRCYARDVLTPDEIAGMTVEEVTARIAAVLEREIRQFPGQWLWTYKRWKRRLDGFNPARYPFYADC